MRKSALLAAVMAAAAVVVLPPSAGIATTGPKSSGTTVIRLGKAVPMFDYGAPISYVGVPASITCFGGDTRQFNAFVSQPQAPGSFGYVNVACDGRAHKFAIAVQSNFGTTYNEGPATATVTDNTTTTSATVTIFRAANVLAPG
jgi:hypothetical protein